MDERQQACRHHHETDSLSAMGRAAAAALSLLPPPKNLNLLAATRCSECAPPASYLFGFLAPPCGFAAPAPPPPDLPALSAAVTSLLFVVTPATAQTGPGRMHKL